MTARNQPPAKVEAPLENLKLRRGMLVVVHETPGIWQVLDPAPRAPGVPAGSWWLTPWDDAARKAKRHPVHGAYRRETYRTLKSANARS